MISLGLRINEMELGFIDLFTSYNMDLETHGHAQIGKQTRVSWTPNWMLSLGLTSSKMEVGSLEEISTQNWPPKKN